MIKDVFVTSFLLFLAIIVGSVAGLNLESVSVFNDYVDYFILVLIFLVFLDVPVQNLKLSFKQPQLLFIAWATNFLILPLLGYGLATLFFPNQPLVAIGLAVYFMSPCTDWFLGFTRMANGNVALGSVLLPINMLTQLLLYPFMLQWFSESTVASMNASEIISTLTNWFVLPVVIAVVVRLLTMKVPVVREKLGMLTNWVLYTLVLVIFSVNIQQISHNLTIFAMVVTCVVAFFVLSSVVTESVAKLTQLSHENHVLYSMTTTARNAPMMLGLTMIALPNQPLVYATIIIGMLIEFPFLTLQVARFNAMLSLKNKRQKVTHDNYKENLISSNEMSVNHDNALETANS